MRPAERQRYDWPVREILDRVGAGAIEAVGVTGQAPTLLAVGADGRPLGAALLWLDVRGEGEVPGLAARLTADLGRVTGNRLHAACQARTGDVVHARHRQVVEHLTIRVG